MVRPVVEIKENPNIAPFKVGDTVRVSAKVREGDRERTQTFEGVVIRQRNGGIGGTFTVRRVSHGVGVERTFMIHSPLLEKVEVTREAKVGRSRLYYLRGLSGKTARQKIKAAPRRK